MMKAKNNFVVSMGSASAVCLLATGVGAAEVASPENATADISSPRSSLQISSEVTPDFLSFAPPTFSSSSARAQWIENPLLKPQQNGGAWRATSDVQLLDAPHEEQSFEIEILPAQPAISSPTRALQGPLAQRLSSGSKTKISLQTQQAAKIAVERARLLESAGVPIMAAAQLRRAVALAPRDIAARRALAQWTAQHEKWPEAAAQWREVLYQLQTQSAAPEEIPTRETWRAEATRELRGAQDRLFAFWQVPNVVTLGADSQNPIARNATSQQLVSQQPIAITLANTSRALANPTSSPALPATVSLLMATTQPQSAPVESAVENVVATLPKSGHRFDIVVTSSSYLRPQNSAVVKETKMNRDEKDENVVTTVALDSSREAARVLSMQRQLQPWLGDIVHIGSADTNEADTNETMAGNEDAQR